MSVNEDMDLVVKSLNGDADKVAGHIYETYCTYGSHDEANSKRALAALIRAVQHHASNRTFKHIYPKLIRT
jgi:hypothetical protein